MRDIIFIDETEIEGDDADNINNLGPEDFILMTDLLAIVQASYAGISYIQKPLVGVTVNSSIPQLNGSPYTTTEYWIGPHVKTKFEISDVVTFDSGNEQTYEKTSGDLTEYVFPSALSSGTYYARLKYFSSPESSIWSDAVEFTI